MSDTAFDRAVETYRRDPTPGALKELLLYAVNLSPQPAWRNMRAPGAKDVPWKRMRVVCDRELSGEEAARLHGCFAYALKSVLAGEELPLPDIRYPSAPGIVFTVLEMDWDSTTSTRTSPDYADAFSKARSFIFEGTPLRTTDREGSGTKGTRLVEGIALCNLSFFLR